MVGEVILSIESSCDDSSIALTNISDCALIFHQKISQDAAHSAFGGVLPELASRLHCVNLPRILAALKNSGFDFAKIAAIAVTTEPGLSVSLIEGAMMAKALSLAIKRPLIAINHLKAHIFSLFLGREATFPLSILLVSGGHSLILEADGYRDVRVIAASMDDSFGEAFDKVAKMLGLGYPGGPVVEKYAAAWGEKNLQKMANGFARDSQDSMDGGESHGSKNAANAKNAAPGALAATATLTAPAAPKIRGDKNDCAAPRAPSFCTSAAHDFFPAANLKNPPNCCPAHAKNALHAAKIHGGEAPIFPVPLRFSSALAFSFSGLKNAVRVHLEGREIDENVRERVCFAFQNAAIAHIAQKVKKYLKTSQIADFAVVGGASANLALRGELEGLANKFGKNIHFAPLEFCSDNAAMVGRLGVEAYRAGDFTPLDSLEISPKWRG